MPPRPRFVPRVDGFELLAAMADLELTQRSMAALVRKKGYRCSATYINLILSGHKRTPHWFCEVCEQILGMPEGALVPDDE